MSTYYLPSMGNIVASKSTHTAKWGYLVAVGIGLILSLWFIIAPYLTMLFLLPFIFGIVLHKKIKVLLVLTILYILFFFTLTTILWTEYLTFVARGRGFYKLIYNPLLICILAGFLTYVVFNVKSLLFVLRTRQKEFKMISFILIGLLILLLTLLLNFLVIKLQGVHPDFAKYIGNFFLPITMFIAVIIAVVNKDLEKSFFITILKITVFLSLLIAFFGIYEFARKENFLYERLQTKDSFIWHAPYFTIRDLTPYRIFTFMGHPISSGFLFMVAVLYSLIMKRTRFLYFSVFAIAFILTFTRTTIILLPVLLLLFVVLRKESVIGRRMLFISVVILISLCIYLSPLSQGLEKRFEGGGVSTAVRIEALKYAKNSLSGNIPNLLLGRGGGKSREISEGIIATGVSFEIPWIMMAVDNGIIVTFIYMFILLYIVIVLFKNIERSDNLTIVSFLVVLGGLVHLSSCNAIVDVSQMSLFLWYLISLSIGYRFAGFGYWYYPENLNYISQ